MEDDLKIERIEPRPPAVWSGVMSSTAAACYPSFLRTGAAVARADIADGNVSAAERVGTCAGRHGLCSGR
jgi:hypothetical protein